MLEAPPLPAGTIIGERYRIDGPLGRGGYGTVYRATQLSIERTVALKVINRELKGDPKPIKRFYREAKAASQLTHPNIVRIFDFGLDESISAPFLVMELVEGQTLKSLLQTEGALSQTRAATILAQVLRALVEAHEKGIVHRDLKPDNVMVSMLPDGTEHTTVLDFGVAKVLDSEGSLTRTGGPIGTPLYMSPEQVGGNPVDFRSDLYSLGCVLHEVLTGAPPYNSDRALAVMYQHVHDEPPMLPDTLWDGAPPGEGMILLHEALLAKAPDDRPTSTQAVLQVVSAIAEGAPVTADMLRQGGPPRRVRTVTRSLPSTGLEDTLPSPGGVEQTSSGNATKTGAVTRSAHLLHAQNAGIRVREKRPLPRLVLVAAASSLVIGAVYVNTDPSAATAPRLTAPRSAKPPPDERPVRPRLVLIQLDSDPSGADILVDGRFAGTTPKGLTLATSTSTRTITFKKAGYQPIEQRVVPKTPAAIKVALMPSPRSADRQASRTKRNIDLAGTRLKTLGLKTNTKARTVKRRKPPTEAPVHLLKETR